MGIKFHSVLNADRSIAVLDINLRPFGKRLH